MAATRRKTIIANEQITCRNCEETKHQDEFYSYRDSRNGRTYKYRQCKSCALLDSARRAKARPKETARISRKSTLKQFGLTLEQYEEMVAAQAGKCAICQKPPARWYLSVDHDHETGNVRKLLCKACNVGLGCFDDNPDFLEKAAEYLRLHGKGLENPFYGSGDRKKAS